MTTTPKELWQRLISFLRFGSREAEFKEEMAAHLDMATEEFIERGMSEAEARRQARLSFGSLESAKEEHRDSRGLPFLENLTRSLRLALRTLRRDAGLTTFAILIIGLGVGASTMVFSVANALLLRPLPFTEPERLVWVANGESSNLSSQTVQVNNLLDLEERSQTLTNVEGFFAFYGAGDIRLGGASEPTRLTGVPVTEGFFELLGVDFRLGRSFTHDEVGADNQVAILGHDLWQSHFSADPDVIGETIVLDGAIATIIGVLANEFDFSGTFTPGKSADLFTPYPLNDEMNRQGNTLALIGRLEQGVNLETAQAESTMLAEQIRNENSDNNRNDFEPRIAELHGQVSGRFKQSLLILCGAVGFLMLIVCANLSNLLLAKAATRQREMAVHVALGAGRSQLVRQMLTESLLLSLGGALLGLVFASFGTAVLAGIEGTNIPLLRDVRLDVTALSFTALVATITGVAFGLTPALQASSKTPAHTLRESGRTSTEGRSGRWLRSALVISEIALACVLLTGVGLLLRSFVAVLDVEMGFETENVLALRVDPIRGLEPAERVAYYDGVLRQVRAVPGVDAAGLTDALPLGNNFGWRTWDASAGDEENVVFPLVRVVDDGYLNTMRLRLKSGRFFSTGDTSDSGLVVVVNETLASQLWPDTDALGKELPHQRARLSRGGHRGRSEVLRSRTGLRAGDVSPDSPDAFYKLGRSRGPGLGRTNGAGAKPANGAPERGCHTAHHRLSHHGAADRPIDLLATLAASAFGKLCGLRPHPGLARCLRSHLLLGQSEASGNGCPHGLRRHRLRSTAEDRPSDASPGTHRHRPRVRCGMGLGKGPRRGALRCQRIRSSNLYLGPAPAGPIGHARKLSSRPPDLASERRGRTPC